jgi:pimeloyl-ACP methyl ester carboxylesterase
MFAQGEIMTTVTSKDGTTIAYEKSGQGPAVILVDGALCHRNFGPMRPLAEQLKSNYTVYAYDRRGRGESGDTQPYAVEREIEDLEALLDAAGGSAFVYGTSSGAALAMVAAVKLGSKIKKLAMYEPPYNADNTARHGFRTYSKELRELLAANRRGDAAARFMQLVGMPAEQLEGMRHAPMWPMFEAVAPTLAYDAAVLGEEADVPTGQAARVSVPTLVMNGGAGYPFMEVTVKALANVMPNGQHRIIEGQTHDLAAEAVAPVLREFFR